jgi:hypothetical protein
VNLVCCAAIKFKIPRQYCNIIASGAYWPSRILRFELRQLFLVLKNFVADTHHQPSALGGIEPPPSAIQRALRSLHGQIDLMSLSTADCGEDLSIYRRDQWDLLAVLS